MENIVNQNNDLLYIIKQIDNNFNLNSINDYQKVLLIIYNSLFYYKDQSTSAIKYETIQMLQSIIEKINNYSMTHITLIDLDSLMTPFFMYNNNFKIR